MNAISFIIILVAGLALYWFFWRRGRAAKEAEIEIDWEAITKTRPVVSARDERIIKTLGR